jgi:hypothetical protein
MQTFEQLPTVPASVSNDNSSSTTTKPKKTLHFTHTNSDRDCLQNPQSPFAVAFYRLQLYNGLYMLDTSEQVFLYGLALLIVVLSCWYSRVFVQGLVDGWKS